MTRMSDPRSIDCNTCPIRHRAVCARCDAAELDQLAAIKTYRSYSAGAQIMLRGAAVGFVASVVTGVVSLSKTLEDGMISNESVADIDTIIFSPFTKPLQDR